MNIIHSPESAFNCVNSIFIFFPMPVGKGRSFPGSSWLLLLLVRERDRETVAVAGKSLWRVWVSSHAKISWYSSGWAD